ncbi:unnamed protein product [Bursaphelenchus xylophilus]|uniref:(pine wood nematode) hypothetical protein n=1 Tax=Bursaphelenchus xylophilus TaxID=6326 RepID=A0A1I7S8Q6_BURXY|nr:unnamed protein product [Bursaphelenchus xylophilus]CAG9089323.1 unnamed protein product [Bursaphelenchus xylophilus]
MDSKTKSTAFTGRSLVFSSLFLRLFPLCKAFFAKNRVQKLIRRLRCDGAVVLFVGDFPRLLAPLSPAFTAFGKAVRSEAFTITLDFFPTDPQPVLGNSH